MIQGNPIHCRYDHGHFEDRRYENEVDHAGRVYKNQKLGFSGKGPKNYKKDDQRIKDDVCDTLFKSYDVDASDIDVNVEEGVVTLSGKVENRFMKRAAEDCADEVRGVVDVKNELTFERKVPQQRQMGRPDNNLGTRLA
ncbi:MAG: BON domain-containing protein [Bacteriovoracia bacterium]